jgi:hypothetical protein
MENDLVPAPYVVVRDTRILVCDEGNRMHQRLREERRKGTMAFAMVRWFPVLLLVVMLQSRSDASCGDYLSHASQGHEFATESQRDPLPGTNCSNGSCRSQNPIPVPVDPQTRMEYRRSDVENRAWCSQIPTSSTVYGFAVDENSPRQPSLDVVVPPPRG